MPMALPAIAAAFVAVGDAAAFAITGIGAAIGATGALASTIGGIAAGVGGFISALGGAAGFGAAFSAWSTTLFVGSSLASLVLGAPKPASAGTSLTTKLDPQAPIPIVLGRSGTGGYLVNQSAHGSSNKYLDLITVLSAGPVQGIENHYLNYYLAQYDRATLHANPQATVTGLSPAGGKQFRNKVKTVTQLGTSNEPSFSDSGVPISGFTSASKMSGLAAVYHQYETDQDAFPQGLPSSLWTVSGIKAYDPRKDSTFAGGSGSHRLNDEATWTFTENPYILGLAWIIGHYSNGVRVWGIGTGLDTSLIDWPAFVYGANIADANSWKCGGVATSSDDKFAVLNAILQSGGGFAIESGGPISCYVSSPKTSVWTVTEADIVGQVQIQNTTSYRDRKNRIVPQYKLESQFWNQIAGEVVTSSTYLAEDGGEPRTIELQLPYVQQTVQAHQIAAYTLCDTREFLQVSVVCKPRLLNVKVGQVLTLNVPDVANYGSTYLVIGRSLDPSTLQVTLTLRSETASKHAFALGQSQVEPASPALNLYDPTSPDAPQTGSWTISATSLTNSAGASVPALVVTGAVDDPHAQSVIVEYRVAGTSEWKAWKTSARNTTEFDITAVVAGVIYEVAVSYLTVLNQIGARLVLSPATAGSQIVDWGGNAGGGVTNLPVGLVTDSGGYISAGGVKTSSGTTVEAALAAVGGVADTTPPAIPTALTLSSALNSDQTSKLTATWTAPGDTDLQGYEIGIATNGGNEVIFAAPAATYSATLPAATPVVVRVRALDRSGNRSGWTSTVSATTVADTTAPGPPSTPTATGGYGSDWLGWVNDTSADLVAVEIWAATTNDLSTATQRATVFASPGQQSRWSRSNIATGTVTYWWLRSVDRSGNKSAFTSSASDTVAGLTDGDIASIAAAKLTGTITSTQISDSAISTPKLAAGAVATNNLAAGAVTSDKITSRTIVSTNIASGTLTSNEIQAGSITGDRISTSTSLPGSVTVGNTGVTITTVQSQAATGASDPGTRINAGTTKIDPGKITISGATTLSDWRNGGDTTKIEGGSIAANTITANSLKIGSRGISVQDLTFQAATASNTCLWTGGYIFYVADDGSQQAPFITNGSVVYSGSYQYIYWVKGEGQLRSTTSWPTATAANNVHIATYQGAAVIVQSYGGTIIDGDRITTGSIVADKLNVTDLSAISANLGTITVGSANIQDLTVGTAKIANNAVTRTATSMSTTSTTISTSVTFLTRAYITTYGGSVEIQGQIIGEATNNASDGSTQYFHYYVYRDDGQITNIPVTVMGGQNRPVSGISGGPYTVYTLGRVSGVVSSITSIDTPAAGSHYYDVYASVSGCSLRSDVAILNIKSLEK